MTITRSNNRNRKSISWERNSNRGVALGGQWGTYVPGRQGAGAPKWNLQKFHYKGKKTVTSKIAPELRCPALASVKQNKSIHH